MASVCRHKDLHFTCGWLVALRCEITSLRPGLRAAIFERLHHVTHEQNSPSRGVLIVPSNGRYASHLCCVEVSAWVGQTRKKRMRGRSRGRSSASSPRRKNFMVGKRGSRRGTQKNQLAGKGTAGDSAVPEAKENREGVVRWPKGSGKTEHKAPIGTGMWKSKVGGTMCKWGQVRPWKKSKWSHWMLSSDWWLSLWVPDQQQHLGTC